MNVNKVLQIVEERLLSRQLSPVEKLIIGQSWSGKKYSEMAEQTAYGSDYLKEIGSQLWKALSEATGEKVTKKNFSLLFDSAQTSNNKQLSNSVQNVSIDTPFSFPGSPLPIDSPLYINRPPVEELIYEELKQPGCVIRVKAPRKAGKSSLLNRILFHAQNFGYRSICLDLQEADKAVFTSLNQFLRWFCSNISRLLNLEPVLDIYWDEEMGSKVSCKAYFEFLLAQLKSPIVLTVNEVHRVFEHPQIAVDFLPMLRFWHEIAQHHEVWRKLRLVIIYTTEIYLPLRLHQSPFNVGLSIYLPPFGEQQVQELATRYGLSWHNTQTQQLMAMVGGHPYLVNVAFYYLAYQNMPLKQLLREAPTLSGVYSPYLRGHLLMLQEEPQLARILQQVVSADESIEIDAIAAYKLESIGLVQLNGNLAKPSCEMYRLYFRQQLRQIRPQRSLNSYLHNLDKLTQIPNREYFNQYLERHQRNSPALILCHLDYFVFSNSTDSFSSNACLQLVANAICTCVGDRDAIVARYDTQEFAVVLPQVDGKTAIKLAQTIQDSIKALAVVPHDNHLGNRPLTASIGVASIPPQTTPKTLIEAAEASLAQSIGDRVTLSTANSIL